MSNKTKSKIINLNATMVYRGSYRQSVKFSELTLNEMNIIHKVMKTKWGICMQLFMISTEITHLFKIYNNRRNTLWLGSVYFSFLKLGKCFISIASTTSKIDIKTLHIKPKWELKHKKSYDNKGKGEMRRIQRNNLQEKKRHNRIHNRQL